MASASLFSLLSVVRSRTTQFCSMCYCSGDCHAVMRRLVCRGYCVVAAAILRVQQEPNSDVTAPFFVVDNSFHVFCAGVIRS
jgi:hypothetical protein